MLCAGLGTLNAVIIVTFRADAIAATLGALVALRGLTHVVVSLVGESGSISAFDAGLFTFTNGRVLFLPQIFVIALLVVIVAAIVVARTRIGRHVQATGGDETAARRAGIAVARVRYAALIVSALGAGIGGIILVGLLGSASALTGQGLEFEVYAALMIGGYSILRGGVGNPIGGALGLLAVAGLSNILDLTATSPYFVNIIVGLLLLAAVLLDRLRGGEAYE
jgi:ribose transport system permease protein